MLDSLIRWSLYHRAVVLFLAAVLLLWGGYAIRDMPLDVLPDLTAPTVTILVEGRGMVPTEMESLVTFPIESAINGAPGVRRVRSATAVGVAVIWVEFEWGQEIYRARQIVNEKLSLVAASLPPNVDQPFLAPISSIMGEILFITLESDRHSAMEVRTVADTVLRRRILATPGVAQVVPTGGDQKQYQVLVSPESLQRFSISLGEVEAALRQGSQNSSAGFRVAGGQEYLIQGVGRASSEAAIGQIAVTSRAGRPTCAATDASTLCATITSGRRPAFQRASVGTCQGCSTWRRSAPSNSSRTRADRENRNVQFAESIDPPAC